MIKVDIETEIGRHRTGPLGQVGAAQRKPALQCLGIGLIGARPPAANASAAWSMRDLSVRDARSPAKVLRHCLGRLPEHLLRQVAHGRRRRAHLHGPLFRFLLSGQQPQQGRLPGAVDADQADDVTGPTTQVETAEQGPITVLGGEAPSRRVWRPCRATLAGSQLAGTSHVHW